MPETDASSRQTLRLPLQDLSHATLVKLLQENSQRLSAFLIRSSLASAPDVKSVRRCCMRLNELAKELEARSISTFGQR